MGAFADSLFTLLLGWVRGAVGAVSTAFSSGGQSGFLQFLGHKWLPIVLGIVVIGLFGDWFIWMVRWQPYRVWGTHMRRIARALHISHAPEEEIEEEAQQEQDASGMLFDAPGDADMEQTALYQKGMKAQEENIDFAPEEMEDGLPELSAEDEAAAYEAAESVQDDQLGDYPGKRYDMSAYMRPPEPEEPVYEPEQAERPMIDPEGAQDEAFLQADAENAWEYAREAEYEPVNAPYMETYEPLETTDLQQEEAYAQQMDMREAQIPSRPEDEVPPDVEFSVEFDPLAAYDDPQVLKTFMRPQAVDEEIPSWVEETQSAASQEGQEKNSRRRRRRVSSAEQGDAWSRAPLNTTWDPPLSPREQAARALARQQQRQDEQGNTLIHSKREGTGANGRSVLSRLFDEGGLEENTVLPPRVNYQEAFKPPVSPEGWGEGKISPQDEEYR